MLSPRRLRVPSILLLALVAVLAFTATAAAETKIGEGSSPENTSLSGEADLLKANANYESTTGAVTFNVTTRAAIDSTPEGERPGVSFMEALFTFNGTCDQTGFQEATENPGAFTPYPIYEIETGNNPEPGGSGEAIWFTLKEAPKEGSGPETYGAASKVVSGTTLTTTATTSTAIGNHYNCVLIESNGGSQGDILVFPLTTKPEPPAVVAPAPPAPTAAFSLAKIKTLKAKEGKWTKVNVKVTNTGNAAAGPIAIKAKAPKGVVLQPASGSLKLPALLAGQSWTVTFRVKLTSKAKKSSKISLTTSSGAISAASSFAIKLLG